MKDPDTLTLIVGGVEIDVWEDVSVTLRAEGFPNSFSATCSAPATVQIRAGQEVTVLLGSDQVIAGYVDRVVEGGDAEAHELEVSGRGRTQDLVDCGAEWPSGQMLDVDALTIASNLSKPYGVTVQLADGAAAGPKTVQWVLNLGEAPADIIQRFARNAGLLAYENASGQLLLANPGMTRAASGVKYGVNVQSWSAKSGMDQRFSEYVCSHFSIDPLLELAGSNFFDTEPDPNVLRHRRMYVIDDQVAEDPTAFTIKRAKWEASRRAGRSVVVHATVDGWRDSAGTLWTPNTLIPVDVPGNQGGNLLCLSEVTFRRSSETGTIAELVMMPAAAFGAQPVVLIPIAAADIQPVSQDQ